MGWDLPEAKNMEVGEGKEHPETTGTARKWYGKNDDEGITAIGAKIREKGYKKCISCSRKIKVGVMFCPYCSATQKNEKMTRLIMLLILLVGIAILYTANQHMKEEETKHRDNHSGTVQFIEIQSEGVEDVGE